MSQQFGATSNIASVTSTGITYSWSKNLNNQQYGYGQNGPTKTAPAGVRDPHHFAIGATK